MSFWKTLIPDEPFILDDAVDESRYLNRLPPAVKSWCVVSIFTTVFVVALATPIFQNAGPLLVGAIFALFPTYMLLFWKDLASAVKDAKQKGAERNPFFIQIRLSVQWCAISLCVGAPAMTAGVCMLLWFTRMTH